MLTDWVNGGLLLLCRCMFAWLIRSCTVLSGGQMVSNAQALQVGDELSATDLAALFKACQQAPEEYWAERSALAWN